MIIDKAVRPVQCPDCQTWTLLGTCSGFKTAVTATPLNLDGYRAALLAGLDVYVLNDRTRKLGMALPGRLGYSGAFLRHGCRGMASVPLDAPQTATQGVCRVRPGERCADVPGVVSCGRCEPPPFGPGSEVAARGPEAVSGPPADASLFVHELGARVMSITIAGREVYCGERCCTLA